MQKKAHYQNYLITGGMGFIGAHLARALLKQNNFCTVMVLDRVLREEKFSNLPSEARDRLCLIKGDYRNETLMKAALRKTDFIFHLAATVSVGACDEDPVESHANNVTGLVQLLNSLKSHDQKLPLVFSSSAAVYGNSGISPLAEADAKHGEPQSFYAAQKLASEKICRLFAINFKLPISVVRFFNVYGPEQDPRSPYSGVISIFADRLTERRALTIHGDGKQTRDFVHVNDIVSGLLAHTEKLNSDQEFWQANPINLASGKSVSLLELINEMKPIFGSSAVEFGPFREGDVKKSCALITEANRTLSYAPKVSLAEGLTSIKA